MKVPRHRRRRPVALIEAAAAEAGPGGHDGGVLEVRGEVEVLKLLWEAARRGDLRRFAFYKYSLQNKYITERGGLSFARF